MKIARIVVVIVLIALGLGWFAFRTESERSAERAAAAREAAERSAVSKAPAPEAPPAATPAPVAEPESPTPVAAYSPEDPVGIVVYGTVRAPDGTLVAESWISARSEDGASRRSSVTQGGFAITGLHPGSWTLSCEVDGIGRVERTLVLAESLGIVRQDLVLEGSTLVLVRFVCPDGTPLRERLAEQKLHIGLSLPLVAVATREPPGATLPPMGHRPRRRFGLGEFQLGIRPGVPLEKGYDGAIETSAPPPYLASAVLRDTVLDTVPVYLGDEEVVFTVSIEEVLEHLCTIRAHFVDAETGASLTGGLVMVSDKQSMQSSRPIGEEGNWVVEGKVAGSHELQVHSPAYESFSFVFTAQAPETDLGELRIDPATSARGSVVDEAGSPVACSLTGFRLDRFESRWAGSFDQERISERSNSDGTFDITRLGRARYLFFPGEPYACTATLVDTRAGPVEGLIVRVSAGVDVKIISGAELATPLALRIDDERGLPVRAFWATGPFTLRLAPGRYSVRVDDGARVRSATFTVGSEPLEVTVAP